MDASTQTYLDASDRQWLHDLAQLCRSQSNFLLAALTDHPFLDSYAAKVLTWRNGRFQTIAQLMEHCESHDWNTAIYEAWVWKTGEIVHELLSELNDTAARALSILAECHGYCRIDSCAKDLALEYARACLDGYVPPALERAYFDFDEFDAV